MQDFLYHMVIVALLATFILSLLRKWRVIESWWVSVFLSVICAVITGDLTSLLIPFCSTPLIKCLL